MERTREEKQKFPGLDEIQGEKGQEMIEAITAEDAVECLDAVQINYMMHKKGARAW